MPKLILVRHGESQWNLENRFTGWVDVPLSPKGEEEAKIAGEHLKDFQIDKLYTSVLQRAINTAKIALETAGQGIRVFGFSPGTIDTDMQVKIRASGINPVSQIPRGNLAPVEHAVRGLLYLCDSASDDLIGQDVSIRDEAVRLRVGLQ